MLDDNSTYMMRINPYMRHDKTSDGLVINFIDVTEIKNLSSIIQGVSDCSASAIIAQKAVRDKQNQIVDLEYIATNHAEETVLGVKIGHLHKNDVAKVYPPDENYFNRFV